MFGAISSALGMGLVILWVAGLSSRATSWLFWLDGLGGLLAIAAGLVLGASTRIGSAASAALALGLFLLWIVALATGATAWLTWWTPLFGFAFLSLAAGSAPIPRRLSPR